MKPRALAAFALLASAQAGAIRPHSLSVQLDSQPPHPLEYRLWSGHPYVQLKDTWLLGWAPYLDTVHGLADLAGCLRLESGSTRIVGVWVWPGARGATLGDELPPLPVPTRKVQNEMWLPLDSVAERMGYKVSFDARKQLLLLKSYPRAGDNTIPGTCQASLRTKRP